MSAERPAKRRRFTSDIVTLKVGESKSETFTIHADTLKQHSPFFKAALDKKWREGQSLQVDFPEDEPDTIEAYLGWLHDGKVEAPESPGTDDLTFPFLAKLYVLGEKIQDNAFCNSVIDKITEVLDSPEWEDSSPGFSSSNIIYDGTPDDSPARTLFAFYFLHYGNFKKDESMDRLHPAFLRDILVLHSSRKDPTPNAPLSPKRQEWHKKT
ncbi:hypothetical protein PRZ48_013016 [Zasmidium cellare]|uniref:BTB domain-containing protein n=1 Tax=Zasmidium cellare TaxID=395010 RepID=A0ABR0E3R1_ZASCE|nr:hypothetical protein PRZ48_013016 [Zasmidium cellare]